MMLTFRRHGAGTHRGGRLAAAIAGLAVAALGVGAAVWVAAPGSSVAPTLAAFSDTAQVRGSATALTVPAPTGQIACTNGASNSGTINLSWPDVANGSGTYRYRVDISYNGTAVHSYDVSDPAVVVHKDDIGERGTYDVQLSVLLDGTTWQSASTIARTVWSSNWLNGDINCG